MSFRLVPFALLAACAGGGAGGDTGYGPPVELATPDLSALDLDETWNEAFRALLAVDARAPWASHVDGLDRVTPGCPDLYYGVPPVNTDEIDEEAEGMSWSDYCLTPGNRLFAGYAFWQNAASATGSLTAPSGLSSSGSRALVADALVSESDSVAIELDGTFEDSFVRIQYSGAEEWVYNSRVDATVSGSVPQALGVPAGGYRADLVLSYRGGDIRRLDDARGNVYFPERRIAERFDSIAIDLAHSAPGNNVEDCPDEPLGYISLRDENAFWYDLVFQPRYGFDDTGNDNDPYSACDGCGMLYVRGLAQGIEVCPDFSFLWDGSVLTSPSLEEFLLSSRDFGVGGN